MSIQVGPVFRSRNFPGESQLVHGDPEPSLEAAGASARHSHCASAGLPHDPAARVHRFGAAQLTPQSAERQRT